MKSCFTSVIKMKTTIENTETQIWTLQDVSSCIDDLDMNRSEFFDPSCSVKCIEEIFTTYGL